MEIPAGTEVVVQDMHPEDEYYPKYDQYVGRKATVEHSLVQWPKDSRRRGWMHGTLRFGNTVRTFAYIRVKKDWDAEAKTEKEQRRYEKGTTL